MSRLPENLPSTIYAEAWATLYNCFGERMQQEELDLMDSILGGIEANHQEKAKWHLEHADKTDIES